MKFLSPTLLASLAFLFSGCGLVSIPGFSDLSDEEARKRLYKAETFIELGAYAKAEKELAAFPKKTKHRASVDELLDQLNDYRVQPDEEEYYE